MEIDNENLLFCENDVRKLRKIKRNMCIVNKIVEELSKDLHSKEYFDNSLSIFRTIPEFDFENFNNTKEKYSFRPNEYDNKNRKIDNLVFDDTQTCCEGLYNEKQKRKRESNLENENTKENINANDVCNKKLASDKILLQSAFSNIGSFINYHLNASHLNLSIIV
jgi:hypothetical protein